MVISMKNLYTPSAPAAIGPYSQAVEVQNTVYTSGQIGIDPETGNLRDGLEAQVVQIMKNLSAILENAGLGFENVVKTTCFLADMNDFADFNEIYSRYFTSKPARSCVEVSRLPKNALAEIEVIAVK